ncbi:MAG: cobalamin-dependent protein [Actinomycetota bacterium]|nr:cobalamin-dependent protein [Actinomycetota bacterium]
MTVTSDDVGRYVGFLESAARADALELALALGAREPPVVVVTDLLGAAQVEVGRRWQANEWNVGREYAATAITDYVLAALSSRWPADPRPAPPVVVLCAEGESHALPARMAAEVLRLQGWPVTMLGAALPTEYVERYLRDHHVLACAVSCTLGRSLPGARRLVESAHACGIPVLAGGEALNDARAARIGADAWAAGATEGAAVLDRWAADPPAGLRAPAEAPTGYGKLAARLRDVGGVALGDMLLRVPGTEGRGRRWSAGIRGDLDLLLEFLIATLLMDDVGILVEFVQWLERVMTAREEPVTIVAAMVDSVAAALDEGPPSARVALAAARRVIPS